MVDYIRVAVIFIHLIIFALAISLLIQSDYKAFFSKPSLNDVNSMGNKMLLFLVILWCTGIGIVFIDTHFDFDIIRNQHKLLTKFTCVGILTLNAFFLHKVVFKKLMKKQLTIADMYLISVAGAISTSSWFYAGFLGIAKPLVKHFSLLNFLSLYGILIGVSIVIAILIAPIIRRNWINANIKHSTPEKEDSGAAILTNQNLASN